MKDFKDLTIEELANEFVKSHRENPTLTVIYKHEVPDESNCDCCNRISDKRRNVMCPAFYGPEDAQELHDFEFNGGDYEIFLSTITHCFGSCCWSKFTNILKDNGIKMKDVKVYE